MQLQVQTHSRQRIHDDSRLRERLKSGGRDRDGVLTGRKKRECEESGFGGLAIGLDPGPKIGCGYRGGGNSRTRWIGDRALDCARAAGLAECQSRR